MLTSAKHPRVRDLLQKALSEASAPKPKLNGEREGGAAKEGGAAATRPGDSILTPISKQKDKYISMVKISNYGMRVLCSCSYANMGFIQWGYPSQR